MLRIVPWLVVLGTQALSGCSNLPRFSRYEWQDLTQDGGEIALTAHLLEGDVDFPDTPDGVPLADPILEPYHAIAIHGRSDPAGFLTEADQPTFGQCPNATTLAGAYTGDVDFVRFENPGGTVCLLIQLDEFWDSDWDLIAFEYRDECIAGEFLTRGAEGAPSVPASTVVGGCGKDTPENVAAGCNYLSSDASEIALYITGARGSNPPPSMGYTVYAYATTYESACGGLVPDRFVDLSSDTGSP